MPVNDTNLSNNCKYPYLREVTQPLYHIKLRGPILERDRASTKFVFFFQGLRDWKQVAASIIISLCKMSVPAALDSISSMNFQLRRVLGGEIIG